jgi:hypothetical protein
MVSNGGVPEYVRKYPQIQATIPRIYNMLRQLPTPTPGTDVLPNPDTHFEVEARFGTLSADGRNMFQPGVPRSFFEQCLATVSTYGDWQRVTDWAESHDYYYELAPHPEDLRGQSLLVRTSVDFQMLPTPAEDGATSRITTRHMCKSARDKQDFRYTPDVITNRSLTHPGMDIRVSLNMEETVPSDSIPTRVAPKYVRIKNRRSYIYQPAYAKRPLWSIDFTKCWTAATRSEAERRQRAGQTIYEMEIECLDPYIFLTDATRDHYYTATSLMLKVRDFVPCESVFHWEPIFRYGL